MTPFIQPLLLYSLNISQYKHLSDFLSREVFKFFINSFANVVLNSYLTYLTLKIEM